MKPNWQAINEQLSGVGQMLAERQKQKQELEQQMQLYEWQKRIDTQSQALDPNKILSQLELMAILNKLRGQGGFGGGQPMGMGGFPAPQMQPQMQPQMPQLRPTLAPRNIRSLGMLPMAQRAFQKRLQGQQKPAMQKPEPFIQIQEGTDKYGMPTYKTVKNPEYEMFEKRQTKIMEFDVKKEQLKKDLNSFFAIDKQIDRAKGGFWATRGAGLQSQYRAVAQPINPVTGQPDIKGTAARVHDAARKRLRVQLVRAAGDVGNINIVEQEAAEKLIPAFYDSQSSAELKNAYLQEISNAIDSNNPSAVKEVLSKAGVGYIDIGGQQNQQSQGLQTFNIKGKTYRIPQNKISEFKRDMGLQ